MFLSMITAISEFYLSGLATGRCSIETLSFEKNKVVKNFVAIICHFIDSRGSLAYIS